MRVKEQFNKYASCYSNNSIIQARGVELLTDALPKKLGVTIDLGCGNGRLFSALEKKGIESEHFFGVDFADSMLKLHPKSSSVTLLKADFNTQESFDMLQKLNANTLLSASALQWAKDINFTFKNCASTAPFGAFFLFCSGTFKTIHKIAGINSPIYPCTTLQEAFLKHYNATKVQKFNFELPFESTLQMLRYIQQSGVSGNLQLPYSKLKRVLEHYPLKYLEFETMLLIGESK